MNRKSIKISSFISLFLVITITFAQDFQGVATYKSDRKSLKPIGETTEEDKAFNKRISKAFQKEFELVFNTNESSFKVKESLATPDPSNGGFAPKASFAYEFVYKNSKENRFAMEREVFGKKFLVKDKLEKKQWKILDETKTIGKYLCKKAIIAKTYKKRIVDKDGSFKFIDEEKNMIAWFTPQIPVSHGPANYYGLPGLILEIEDGRKVFLCSKIVMNVEKELKIEEPKKGKIVTQKEIDKIFKDKLEENRRNFKSSSKY